MRTLTSSYACSNKSFPAADLIRVPLPLVSNSRRERPPAPCEERRMPVHAQAGGWLVRVLVGLRRGLTDEPLGLGHQDLLTDPGLLQRLQDRYDQIAATDPTARHLHTTSRSPAALADIITTMLPATPARA